ncbi:hypothetical protein GPALN_003778 [Globodera pallida]|nr:hypothetical protein GPALN_003778 [Globodera pallida]
MMLSDVCGGRQFRVEAGGEGPLDRRFGHCQRLFLLLSDICYLMIRPFGNPSIIDWTNGQDKLWRTDFFPGLGWMLVAETWRELAEKWPDVYWDDWLRRPDTRKNRVCIRPEQSRTLHNLQVAGKGSSEQRTEKEPNLILASFVNFKKVQLNGRHTVRNGQDGVLWRCAILSRGNSAVCCALELSTVHKSLDWANDFGSKFLDFAEIFCVPIRWTGKCNPYDPKMRAWFMTKDVAEEIIQDVTLRLFYLQVKDLLLTDEVYCPPDQAVLLASYAMQAKHGDHAKEEHGSGSLANDRLIPQRVLNQFKMNMSEWENRVITWCRTLFFTLLDCASTNEFWLQREMCAREAAEQKQHEYEAKMLSMKEEMESAQLDLEVAQGRIRRLKDQIYELNEGAAEIVEESSRNQSKSERLKAKQLLNEHKRDFDRQYEENKARLDDISNT